MNKEVQVRPKNIMLVQLSDGEGLLESPYVVTTGANLAGQRHIDLDFYKETIAARFGINPVQEERHSEMIACEPCIVIGDELWVDFIYLYASSEHGLMINLNNFGSFQAEGTEHSQKTKEHFKSVALSTGGFVEFDEDGDNYDLNVWFPESILEGVNTFDEFFQFMKHKQWA